MLTLICQKNGRINAGSAWRSIMNRRFSVIFLLAAILFQQLSCAHGPKGGTAPEGSIDIPKEKIVYDDGDTITFDDITIRVLGIDTPEIAHPEHGFVIDQPQGREASARAEELMRQAGRVSYIPFQNDQYGRLLAHLFIDNELLGVTLIREGLAYETISHYGDNGFPELAARILKAADNAPEPSFKPPHIWRRENRTEPATE